MTRRSPPLPGGSPWASPAWWSGWWDCLAHSLPVKCACQGHFHFRIVFDKHIKYLPDQKQYCQWGDQTSSHDNSNEEKLEQWRERGGYLQLKPPSFLVYWYIRPRWYLRPGMISYDVWISRDMYIIHNDIYGYGYLGLDIMLADISIWVDAQSLTQWRWGLCQVT